MPTRIGGMALDDKQPEESLHGALERVSHRLWIARIYLENQRTPGDPSVVFLGDLANILEEFDIATPEALRERLEHLETLENTYCGFRYQNLHQL